MNFKTQIESSSIDILNLDHEIGRLKNLQAGSDYDIENASFRVHWTVEMELREWGVKSIDWIVTDIEGSFDVVLYDEKGDEIGEEHIEFDFGQFKDEVSIELSVDDHQQIAINDIEIDYQSKSVRVS